MKQPPKKNKNLHSHLAPSKRQAAEAEQRDPGPGTQADLCPRCEASRDFPCEIAAKKCRQCDAAAPCVWRKGPSEPITDTDEMVARTDRLQVAITALATAISAATSGRVRFRRWRHRIVQPADQKAAHHEVLHSLDDAELLVLELARDVTKLRLPVTRLDHLLAAISRKRKQPAAGRPASTSN